MDTRDKYSIGIAILSIAIIVYILSILSPEDSTLINYISIIGSITSPAGVLIAILQIFKIKSNNSVFLNTIKVIENNAIIETITRAKQHVGLIKDNFHNARFTDSREMFDRLRIDINEITYNHNTSIFSEKLTEFISFCSVMETSIFDGSLDQTKTALSEKFLKLTELDTILQEIKSVVKRPNQENIK